MSILSRRSQSRGIISTNKAYIEKMDALRAIAILAVFAFHLQLTFFPNYQVETYKSNGILNLPNLKSFLLNFSPAAFGWTGVDLLLIISGFLIHLSYLTQTEPFAISLFYSKRFWRIYPPYFIALLFFCFTVRGFNYYFLSKQGLFDFISHVLLIHNFFGRTALSINGSFWSLALEMQLYLLYPLFLILRDKFTTKKVLIFLLILSQFSVFCYISLVFLGFRSEQLDTLFFKSIFSYWGVWIAGAYLAELYNTKDRVFDHISTSIILKAFFIIIFYKLIGPLAIFSKFITTAFYCLFIAWFLKNRSLTTAGYGMKFLNFLGLCSYSFYLFHQPLLEVIIIHFKMTTGLTLSILLTFLFILSISYASYKLIEQPSINFGIYLRKKDNGVNIQRIN